MCKGHPMNRNFSSALTIGSVITAAAAAATIVTCGVAYADDITVDNAVFVSTKTREEVQAELKKPYPGGDPYSGSYNMSPRQVTTSAEQERSNYILAREEVSARTGEDSGSAYIMKTRAPVAATAMGAPAR